MLGKAEWISPRREKVQAKGKGEMQTYWVEPGGGGTPSRSGSSSAFSATDDEADAKSIEFDIFPSAGEPKKTATQERLVEWNTTIFEDLIKRLVAHRKSTGTHSEHNEKIYWTQLDDGKRVRDEVAQSIPLPSFQKVEKSCRPGSVDIDKIVRDELRALISAVAERYRSNPFHNFDHATHVTMSTKKLLQRIVTKSKTLSQQELYIHSFGVASDPLGEYLRSFGTWFRHFTQVFCLFSTTCHCFRCINP